MPGYELLHDVAWQPAERCWALHFRLRVPLPAEEVRDPDVPEVSDWYVLIAPEFPAGMLSIRPAAEGGLTETYPHQTLNRAPRGREPWRGGVVCVATPARGFGRYVLDDEPRGDVMRLRWRVLRTRSWIEAARRGELLRDGEPFELPIYASSAERNTIAFDQVATDLDVWSRVPAQFGYATLAESAIASNLRVLTGVGGLDPEAPPFIRAEWGSLLSRDPAPGRRQRAAWVRTPQIPVLRPWRAPRTWKELEDSLGEMGMDLFDVLRQLAPGIRDDKAHVLLIGAPVPARVGEAPVLMQWVAVQLPPLAPLAKPRKGFRPSEDASWMRDLAQQFRDTRPLSWLSTENWSPDEIATRGRASAALRNSRIVLVGAGAMGSALAELLVREGAGGGLTVLDGETLTVGNLVRHTLTLSDVGKLKATALADRLNALNPYARVVGVAREFPADPAAADDRVRRALAEADVIIETTGDDALLSQLEAYPWSGQPLFVSAAVGFFARRLFLFCGREACFPLSEYTVGINPWLIREREEIRGREMPWEGTGCWNPVFPARASDFAFMAGVALRQIEAHLDLAPGEHVLHVTERYEDEAGTLVGFRPATLDEDGTRG